MQITDVDGALPVMIKRLQSIYGLLQNGARSGVLFLRVRDLLR
jgi:hypothetical protein